MFAYTGCYGKFTAVQHRGTDVPYRASVLVTQRLGMRFSSEHEFHGLATLFYTIGAETMGVDDTHSAGKD